MNLQSFFKQRAFWIAFLITVLYLGVGYSFLYFQWTEYGWVFFVLLPISIGFALVAQPSKYWVYLSATFGFITFAIFLVMRMLEGTICVILAIPIIIPMVLLGIFLRKQLYKSGIIKSDGSTLNAHILPFVVFVLAIPLEKTTASKRLNIKTIKTERIFNFSPDEVYDAIKSVDTLSGEKPFLMHLDLPVPQKCVLEKEEIGGKRICYFENGSITEQITQLEKGKVLRMDVIDYQLMTPQWLQFKEAIYYFEPEQNGSCKLTRLTTYTSALKPEWYWNYFESLAIGQEHDYIFENIHNILKNKHKHLGLNEKTTLLVPNLH